MGAELLSVLWVPNGRTGLALRLDAFVAIIPALKPGLTVQPPLVVRFIGLDRRRQTGRFNGATGERDRVARQPARRGCGRGQEGAVADDEELQEPHVRVAGAQREGPLV